MFCRYFNSGRIIGTSIRTGDSGDILSQTECANIDKDEPIINKTCAPSIPVRYVTLLASEPNLGLCEVEVEGYEYKRKLKSKKMHSVNVLQVLKHVTVKNSASSEILHLRLLIIIRVS